MEPLLRVLSFPLGNHLRHNPGLNDCQVENNKRENGTSLVRRQFNGTLGTGKTPARLIRAETMQSEHHDRETLILTQWLAIALARVEAFSSSPENGAIGKRIKFVVEVPCITFVSVVLLRLFVVILCGL